MGLSGRKVKQRIPQDPRNLSWADDAARFGSNYLSKFGWDASKGLGIGGDGRMSHIKVDHKLDMLGIGAAHQKDPNGIAWKQNKDFESLLKRLNETAVQNTSGETGDEEIEVDGDKQKKRKRKGNGEDRSERTKTRKESMDHEESENLAAQPLAIQWDKVIEGKAISTGVSKPVKSLPRHRAHRARAIAAKNISSKSSVHISEILGVAPTASTSSQDPAGEISERKLTSTNDTEGLEISKITTSTKSLADYFNEKLNARSQVFKPTDPATLSSSSNDTGDKGSYDAPRTGLGSTRLRIDVHSEARVEEEAQRVGLSKFSSLSSSSFLAATSSLSSYMSLSTKEEKVEGARILKVQRESIERGDGTKKPVRVKRKKSSKRSNGPQIDNGDYQMERSKEGCKGKGKVGETKEKDSVTNQEEEERREEERRKQKKMRRELKESQLAANEKDQGVDHQETKGRKISRAFGGRREKDNLASSLEV